MTTEAEITDVVLTEFIRYTNGCSFLVIFQMEELSSPAGISRMFLLLSQLFT